MRLVWPGSREKQRATHILAQVSLFLLLFSLVVVGVSGLSQRGAPRVVARDYSVYVESSTFRVPLPIPTLPPVVGVVGVVVNGSEFFFRLGGCPVASGFNVFDELILFNNTMLLYEEQEYYRCIVDDEEGG